MVYMSFLKEAGKSLIKYSEKIVEKTEEYTRIAKLILDIKNMEGKIESVHIETGQYVMKKIEDGADSIDLRNDETVINKARMLSELKNAIRGKRNEIEEMKKARAQAAGPRPPDAGAGA
jgi:hypothetical protein